MTTHKLSRLICSGDFCVERVAGAYIIIDMDWNDVEIARFPYSDDNEDKIAKRTAAVKTAITLNRTRQAIRAEEQK